ncbi:MAG: hypothetical protein DRI26_06035 [Chloroflexi bacterium]|nr:MAG: hypothetical protein DRI26_06035 [Chloroflexota bacterium]
MSEYFRAKEICIYNDDFLTIECIPEGSIDLIITSPPYNVDIHYGAYDDKIPYCAYLEFTERWLAKCFKLANKRRGERR